MRKPVLVSGLGLGAVALVLLLAPTRSRVASASVSLTGEAKVHACPAKLEFAGTVKSEKYPVTVECQWERSDGAHSDRRRIEVKSADQRITDTWYVNVPGKQLAVWEKLHVVVPNELSSEPARAEVDCR